MDHFKGGRPNVRVVCSSNHKFARKRVVRLGDLADEHWILPPRSAPLRQQMEQEFIAAGRRPPRRIVESVSILTNQVLLQQTDMLCVMPAETADHFVASGLIKALPIELRPIYRWIALITRDGGTRSPATIEVMRAIKESAALVHRLGS